jgi:hypothetical protein
MHQHEGADAAPCDEPGGDQQSAGRAGLPRGEPEEEPVTGGCAGE